jgi:hypothetical protein
MVFHLLFGVIILNPKGVHRDLVIADHNTELHILWQKQDELNGVQYFKSHAQLFLDRPDAPNNLCANH